MLFLIIFGFTNISFAQKISGCNPQKLIPVKYKQSGYYVKNLQLCLIKIGINIPSGATGYYGKQTIEAVKEFYKLWYGNVSGYSIGQLGIKKLKELVTLLPSKTSKIKFERFKSEKDFMNYLLLANKGRELGELKMLMFSGGEGPQSIMPEMFSLTAPNALTPSPERVSETTVQVKGIDEPDIVKTDGYNIYFSKEPRYVISRPPKESNFISPYYEIKSLLLLINAFPVENLKILSKIDKSGDLLLLKDEKILIIFDKNLNKIYGYDISEPKDPKEKWSIDLKNTSVITARLFKNKIYLATKRFIEINDGIIKGFPYFLFEKAKKDKLNLTFLFFNANEDFIFDCFDVINNLLGNKKLNIKLEKSDKKNINKFKISYVG
ncbi:MAG: beta-propeller domain-containing protein [Candidatus Pacearchaeota archaeon]